MLCSFCFQSFTSSCLFYGDVSFLIMKDDIHLLGVTCAHRVMRKSCREESEDSLISCNFFTAW